MAVTGWQGELITMTDHTYVIAEMACSHDGSPDLAKAIVNAAGESGADAIQLQVWQASDLMVPYHSQFAVHQELQLSREQWREVFMFIRDEFAELDIIGCVYELESLRFCEDLGFDAYKIHSSDLSNDILLRHVAATGKRIDLSIGASTLGEIQGALETIRAVDDAASIWLMYGIQNFPTPPDQIDLAYMIKLGQLFEIPIGYQDHCEGGSDEGLWLPAAAIGMGARIIEKHMTHDRSLKGIDHEAALNPDEFVRFMDMVRVTDAAIGTSAPKPFTAEEIKYRRYAKKRLVASCDIPAGTTLDESHFLFMRAEELSMTPDQAFLLIGHKTVADMKQYDPFREGRVE